jgi:hypothetical protein
MKNHGLWMIIGCVLPMLLIFILPAFGVSGQDVIVIFIIVMFACHFMMLERHDGKEDQIAKICSLSEQTKTVRERAKKSKLSTTRITQADRFARGQTMLSPSHWVFQAVLKPVPVLEAGP